MKWRSKTRLLDFFCSTCFKCEFFAPLKMRRKKCFLMFSFQQLFGRNIMMSTIKIMALKYSTAKKSSICFLQFIPSSLSSLASCMELSSKSELYFYFYVIISLLATIIEENHLICLTSSILHFHLTFLKQICCSHILFW